MEVRKCEKNEKLILLVISICVVLLAGCERKVSEEDALKEFEEAADELMENNVLTKDRTSEQIKGPIILTNAYSDFAAKVIAPDGFLYFNEEDSVFADALAASITESLTYYSDDSDNSLDYLFSGIQSVRVGTRRCRRKKTNERVYTTFCDRYKRGSNKWV